MQRRTRNRRSSVRIATKKWENITKVLIVIIRLAIRQNAISFLNARAFLVSPPTSRPGMSGHGLNSRHHAPPATCRLMFDPLSELPMLNEWFENNSHPTCYDIEKFTEILNSKSYRRTYPPVSTHNVKIWFKNRRAKCKRVWISWLQFTWDLPCEYIRASHDIQISVLLVQVFVENACMPYYFCTVCSVDAGYLGSGKIRDMWRVRYSGFFVPCLSQLRSFYW